MKVLLAAVNAKYIHSNLAVYDLKAYVKNLPVSVEIAEYTINQQLEEILRDIYEKRTDIVGFSCYIWNISYIRTLIRELHKLSPDTRIWLGGPEASYDAKRLMSELPAVELIMLGEGEETFAKLLKKCLTGDKNLSDISGICYRQKEELLLENPPGSYLDMDKIPFVYEDIEKFKNKILYYETSRGCPFRCSYCLSSIDKRVRLRSLSVVFPELQFFLDHRVAQVKFVDRTFNCNHEHAYAIWKYLYEHDNGITNFHFEVAADLLCDEDMKLFSKMRKGLIQLEIGVQSTNPDTIAQIHRKMDLEKVVKYVACVKKMGNIHQHLDLIAGLPCEGFERFGQSFNDVYKMRPDQLQLGFLKVLKGSYLEEHKEEYQLITISDPPYEVLSTKWLSYEERSQLKDVEEMVEVYYNSGRFDTSLQYLIPFFESPFLFYLDLSVYYRRQGWMGLKHTRLFRYDALRKYVKSTGRMDEVSLLRLDEYLIHDLYLTENCKKRPEWAWNESNARKMLKKIRDPKWRREYMEPEESATIEKILQNRTDLHMEQYCNTREGRYLLYDYHNRDVLTNRADIFEFQQRNVIV